MNIEKEIRFFLDEICVDLGFCLPPDEIERLVPMDRFEVDQFVRGIFKIEQLDADFDLRLFRQVKRRFTDRFGEEVNKYE